MQSNKWKILAIGELILILAVVVFAIGFFAGKKGDQSASGTVAQTTSQTQQETTTAKSETETTTEIASETESSESAAFDVVESDNGLNVSFKCVANWGNDAELYYQYNIVMENTSGSNVEEWGIKIPVGEDVEFSQGWNAEFEIADGNFYITPTEYGSVVEAGKVKEDIGFTIICKEEVDFTKAIVGNKVGGEEETTEVKETKNSAKKEAVSGEYYGKLKVDGSNLCDQSGNAVQLQGVSTHGLGWYPQYVNKELFKEFKDDYGVNLIRLAMYTAESGGYCQGGDKTQLMKKIDEGVKYATELSMYVIIDWHILSDGNPNTNKEEAKKFFEEVSKKYADNENVIYEICNEPNGGTSWSDVKTYAEEIIPLIRKNDKDGIILVGTPTWSQDVDVAAKDPIKGYDNIMYTLHFYAATHKDDLINKAKSAMDAGLPLFVSECSICDASGNGNVDYTSADKWLEFMNDNSISYVAWNLSNKDESSAFFKPSCNSQNGFNENDFSETAKWFLESFK